MPLSITCEKILFAEYVFCIITQTLVPYISLAAHVRACKCDFTYWCQAALKNVPPEFCSQGRTVIPGHQAVPEAMELSRFLRQHCPAESESRSPLSSALFQKAIIGNPRLN